ncbi:MAG: hypothetical protein AAGH90_08250 [Pseudomonadota bacterium]
MRHMRADLPRFALSVRQPSAWAILHGGKDIENRTVGSVQAGRMEPGRICIHAAVGLTQKEWHYLVCRFGEIGCAVPPAASLVRRSIIGTVEVVDIVSADQTDSVWMSRSDSLMRGLVLRDPEPIEPIPAAGALGYFEWEASGALAEPLAWMGDGGAGDLFGAALPSFKAPPERPW